MLSSAHRVELWDSFGLGLLLPLGLSHGSGMLSEALGPVLAFLRVTWGDSDSLYMDDFIIQGFSPSQVCLHAFLKQQVTLLRFILISVSMTVSCPLGWVTWESFDGHLHG